MPMGTKKPDIFTSGHLQSVLEDLPPLFRNFPLDSYREFLECGTLEKFLDGQVIISEKGNITNRGWLVTEGEIFIFFNNVLLERIKAGDFLGETFIFRKKRNPVAVIAETDVSMISFRREPILKYCRDRSDRLLKYLLWICSNIKTISYSGSMKNRHSFIKHVTASFKQRLFWL